MRPLLPTVAAVKAIALFLWPWHPLGSFLLFFGSGLIVVYHLLTPAAQGLGGVVTRFETSRRDVWLTIDDGPDACDTPRLLELLDQRGAKATFFLIGERAAALPHLVGEILRRGHEVANHTQRHPAGTFWILPSSRLGREIAACTTTLRSAGAERVRLFRPPLGIKNLFLFKHLAEQRLRCVAWSARGLETFQRDPAAVRKRVMSSLRPGAILLLHEGPRVPPALRVAAIASVLEALGAEGYRCVIPTEESLR